jgi:hypothetical protein
MSLPSRRTSSLDSRQQIRSRDSALFWSTEDIDRDRSGEPGSRLGCPTVSLNVDMKSQTDRPWAKRLYRMLVGRLVRRLSLALLLFLLIFTTGVRIRSVVLARRIQAVLSGLGQLRVDQTMEGQLLKSVPYLVREGDYPRGGFVERYYRVEISNQNDRRWLWRLAQAAPIRFLWRWPEPAYPRKPMDLMSFPFKLAHWLGWRYISFSATVAVQNGRTSYVWYGIETDVEQGWPHDPLIFARSFHGFWMPHALPVPVSDTDDESPTYRVKGTERVLGAEYSPDAPIELIRHVFQVDLSCYWGIRGCVSTREVAPLLWRDKQAIEARATARLHGTGNPCPDSVLAGRIRYLPDLNVELLEMSNHNNGEAGRRPIQDYQVKEVILGRPGQPGASAQQRAPSPMPPNLIGGMPTPLSQSLEGAKYLSSRARSSTPVKLSQLLLRLNRRFDQQSPARDGAKMKSPWAGVCNRLGEVIPQSLCQGA